MNKKAIVLDFLVTLLLAIIIFAPACYFATNLFRLSDQSSNNFKDLSNEIIDLAGKGKNVEPRTFNLIMDENSFIVLFNDSGSVIIDKGYFRQTSNVYFGEKNFSYPSLECSNQACLCLCRTYDVEDKIICTRLNCAKMENIQFNNSWVNIREKGNSQRRVVINLEKNENGIISINGGNIPQLKPAPDEPIIPIVP